MGRAADNERRKLKATFYNNIAAGLALTGVLVPYLGIVGKLGTIIARIKDGPWPSFEEQAGGVAIIVAMVLAFTGSRTMRRAADAAAREIEGE